MQKIIWYMYIYLLLKYGDTTHNRNNYSTKTSLI